MVNQYGSDPVRFYLLQGFSSFADGDFTSSGLAQVNNNFLANGIGNLLSRLWKLREKAGLSTFVSSQTQEVICEHPFRFNLQIQKLWRRIDKINAEINEFKPWEVLKEGATGELILKLQEWTSELIGVGRLAEPYIPRASKQIIDLSDTTGDNSSLPHLFRRI
ncbi:MAG: class I tRNA ligase family protein [Bdellovibrionales bacterium]|nr:class I tRNA ligase family protein [Bdellovibrionales bacterium]